MQQEPKHTDFSPTEKNDRKLTPQEQRHLKRNSVKARRRRKRLVCFALAIVLLLLAAIPGYNMLYLPYQAHSFYRTMKTLYGQAGEGNLPEAYNQHLGALYDVNADIGGWLIVPGTDIDLPVAQTVSHDSVYYVNHLFDGTVNPFGTPYYLNQTVVLAERSNTVIRGGESLLGELAGYRLPDFYKGAPLLFLDTLSDAAIYKVFAVVEIEDSDISAFTQSQFASSADFHAFVTEMGRRSVLHTGITVQQDDQLLTLLCDTKEGKLAVIGRRVRENEDYTVDTSVARLQTAGTEENTVADWTVTPTDTPASTPASTPVSTPASTPASAGSDAFTSAVSE